MSPSLFDARIFYSMISITSQQDYYEFSERLNKNNSSIFLFNKIHLNSFVEHLTHLGIYPNEELDQNCVISFLNPIHGYGDKTKKNWYTMEF